MAKTPVQLVREEPYDRKQYDWESVAAQLRANPDKWHRVFEKERRSLHVAIISGGIEALRPYVKKTEPGPGFRARTDNNDRHAVPNTCGLLMKYDTGKAGK